jgi:hypothetical protein
MYRKPIQRNPLGIRKLDVQAERRSYQRAARTEAARLLNGYLLNSHDEQLLRVVTTAMLHGWEDGVACGALATRERVAEALAKGTLVKP